MPRFFPQWLAIISIAGVLAAPRAFAAESRTGTRARTANVNATTATAAEQPVFVAKEFHEDWANDRAFIDKLVRDANPRYEANKRLVLDFEAALERAQAVKEGAPGNFDEVVDKYLTADYVQYDPIFPPGRAGLLGFFKMVSKSGVKVSHPPVMVVAQGDMVVLTMMRPPVPEPADASKTYTGYRIAIWKVCGKKLCAHWGPDLKEAR